MLPSRVKIQSSVWKTPSSHCLAMTPRGCCEWLRSPPSVSEQSSMRSVLNFRLMDVYPFPLHNDSVQSMMFGIPCVWVYRLRLRLRLHLHITASPATPHHTPQIPLFLSSSLPASSTPPSIAHFQLVATTSKASASPLPVACQSLYHQLLTTYNGD